VPASCTTSGVPPIAKSSEFRNPRDRVILGILGIRGTSWESALPLECLSLRTHLECLSSGYGILGIHGIQGIRGIRGIPCPTSSKTHYFDSVFGRSHIFIPTFVFPRISSDGELPIGADRYHNPHSSESSPTRSWWPKKHHDVGATVLISRRRDESL
jgi:hypothetical protein